MKAFNKYALLLLLGFLSLIFDELNAQDKEIEGCDEVYMIVEETAEFLGGKVAMNQFFKDNLVYPKEAREKGIEGRVIVKFVVDKTGAVSNVQVLRDIGGGTGAEACRVINAMPNWKIARQRGEPKCVWITLPVTFRL